MNSYSKYIDELRRAGLGDSKFVYLILTMKALAKSGIRDPDRFLDQLVDAAGASRIVMNTFSWSFCASGSYDCRETPAETGIIPERFRLHSSTQRSHHPIYSFCFHEEESLLSSLNPVADAWADQSVLGVLCQHEDVSVISDGMDPLRGNPSIHYVEKKWNVPYRYLKRFNGSVRYQFDSNPVQRSAYLFVRRRRHDSYINTWKPVVFYMSNKQQIRRSKKIPSLLSYWNLDLVTAVNGLLRRSVYAVSESEKPTRRIGYIQENSKNSF